jgi:dienelactone hydrolase
MRVLLCAVLLIVSVGSMRAEEGKTIRLYPSPAAPAVPAVEWDKALWEAPEVFSVPAESGLKEEDNIRPVFYEGPAVDGRPTRIFAWLGIPAGGDGKKLPAMVLVHGGGGTAFRNWVKSWNERGYVALAMDTSGKIPTTMETAEPVPTESHSDAGPHPAMVFAHALKPAQEQWAYHGVAAIIAANSLLRSLPEVDPERIGLTGISWGGILTEIAAAQDGRFRLVAPVYGSGFLGENSFWLEEVFQGMPPEVVEKWIALWDPSQYAGRIRMPVLFCNGTNDTHFRLDGWRKTYESVPGSPFLSLKVRMPHCHFPDGDPKEIQVFADSLLKGMSPLLTISKCGARKNEAEVAWSATVRVRDAELVYTLDSTNWIDRVWQVAPAKIRGNSSASARIPDGAIAWFFNLRDERDCVVSSRVQDVPPIGREGKAVP